MNHKTIFWNVDTQYDFMKNNEQYKGKLAINNAHEIEGNLELLTDYADHYQIRVVNTADMHDEDTKEIAAKPDFINTFPEHCMRRTQGAMFIRATAPLVPYVVDWKAKEYDKELVEKNRNIVLYKDHFDIFQGNQYANAIVKQLAPKKAVVYGVATDVCVNYAVRGLIERGIEVFVPTDAIKEIPIQPLEKTLNQWIELGAKLVTTKDILEGRVK